MSTISSTNYNQIFINLIDPLLIVTRDRSPLLVSIRKIDEFYQEIHIHQINTSACTDHV